MDSHYAQYGNTILKRGHCATCDTESLIINNEFQCCGRRAFGRPPEYTQLMSTAEGKRRIPTKRQQDCILAHQKGRCIYCGEQFGHAVFRHNDVLIVRLAWDHVVPFSYTMNNRSTNFVAACTFCNQIKAAHIFEGIDEARVYIQRRRQELGFERIPEKIGQWYELPQEPDRLTAAEATRGQSDEVERKGRIVPLEVPS